MKHLVILFDGTWNDLSMQFPTNVARLAMAMDDKDHDGNLQVIEYISGIGTSYGSDKIIGGAFGYGIDEKTIQGYTFLVNNYQPGDQIYVFGFSRGAYTARSLTGFISECGLLKKHNLCHVNKAFLAYRKKGTKIQKDFLDDFKGNGDCYKKVPIKLLGCWDTVSSLGVPDRLETVPIDRWINEKYEFHQNKIVADIVENAVHAVALDEYREEFDVELMEQNSEAVDQKLIQLWFPGDHGCVGGGSWYKRGLSNLTLKWMVEDIIHKELNLKLALDLSRIVDTDPSGKILTTKIDPLIYFPTDIDSIYEELENGRKIPEDVKLHPSIIQRKKFLGDLYNHPEQIEQRLNEFLDTMEMESDTSEFIVMAENRKNEAGFSVEAGNNYKLIIKDTQVWQDGNLDPCGVKGWKTNDLDKNKEGFKPYNFLKKVIVRIGENFRKSDVAPWFCLVLYTDNGDLIAVDSEESEIHFEQGGKLFACANDAGRAYGNNEGWLVVKVEAA